MTLINKMKQLLNLITFNTYCRQSIFLMVQMCYNKKRNKKQEVRFIYEKKERDRLQVEYICPDCGKHLAWALPTAAIQCPCGQWVDNNNRLKDKSEVYLPLDSEQTVLF